MPNRHEPTPEEILAAIDTLKEKLEATLRSKGRGIFVSGHETVGVLNEELKEYEVLVFQPPKGSNWFDGELVKNHFDQRADELLDIAVTALWGYVSEKSGKQDW